MFSLVVRLKDEESDVLPALKSQLDSFRKTKGGYILKLRERDGSFVIPQVNGWKPEEFCLDVKEFGGLTNKSYGAMVVTGLSGKKLRPYYIPSQALPGGEHAFFCIPESCVTVTVTRDGGVIIKEHFVETDEAEETAFISSKVLFNGGITDPGIPEAYRAAVEACHKKALCPNCVEPHYADVPPMRRRNGPAAEPEEG